MLFFKVLNDLVIALVLSLHVFLTAIRYRFGLEGGEPKTLSEISALTGYTAMGIQKAEKRALGKLKKDDLFKELIT